MNRIIMCNTYSQLLVSVQLKRTIMKNDYVTVIMTDHSNKAEEVYSRIKRSGFFEEVLYWKTKEIDWGKHKRKEGLKHICMMVMGPPRENIFNGLKEIKYDSMLYYNLGVSTMICFAHFYKHNKNLSCMRYEEGILSYGELEKELHVENNRGLVATFVRRILFRNSIITQTKDVYCYYPELYNGSLNAIQIPLISTGDKKFKTLMSEFFNYMPQAYQQKYIYFSSVYDFVGEKPIGEINLIKQIVDRVGKENLIIKVHPRDNIERFKDIGCIIDNNSSIPWEVIQLNNSFDNHIFLTVNSSCVLTMNLCVDKPVKSFFLFKICDYSENDEAKKSIDYIQEMLYRIGIEARFVTVADEISAIMC